MWRGAVLDPSGVVPSATGPAETNGVTMGMTKVVIGYDPSDRAERAFETGVELAGALGAAVHLVTAFSDGPKGATEITPQRRHAEQMLDKAATRVTASAAEVRCHAIPGRPADVVVQVATETSADVVVIGNRGAQGSKRALGSVASAIVGHAPCSVLVVKTD
jgi:nucleotide-binding universal stress UspA family protein